MFPFFLAFIQHVLNLLIDVHIFELVHLLCFAMSIMQHYTSASLQFSDSKQKT